jgi:hypothetical protein
MINRGVPKLVRVIRYKPQRRGIRRTFRLRFLRSLIKQPSLLVPLIDPFVIAGDQLIDLRFSKPNQDGGLVKILGLNRPEMLQKTCCSCAPPVRFFACR